MSDSSEQKQLSVSDRRLYLLSQAVFEGYTPVKILVDHTVDDASVRVSVVEDVDRHTGMTWTGTREEWMRALRVHAQAGMNTND